MTSARSVAAVTDAGSLTLRAPAKVNLTLEILARRADGYHTLRSVMAPVGIEDAIVVKPAERLAFTCSAGELADDNLVLRALDAAGFGDARVAIELTKTIPVGAGLGGGSSDAAAIVLAAMRGAFGQPGERDWIAIARRIGSDVPFFLTETGALVEGTGERVTALGALPPWWLLIVAPDVHVNTGDAYRRLAAARIANPAPVRPRSSSASLAVVTAVQRGDYDATIANTTNDFEPIVCAAYPAVAAALASLRAADAPHAMLSGSGGATFSLCSDEPAARALAERLVPPEGARVFVVPFAHGDAWRGAGA
jgi:4-diphosphocytidyl-2-C-methyl-D-erythritol kinase